MCPRAHPILLPSLMSPSDGTSNAPRKRGSRGRRVGLVADTKPHEVEFLSLALEVRRIFSSVVVVVPAVELIGGMG